LTATLLMEAAFSNPNPAVITTLLKAVADINAREKNDWNALMYAAMHSNRRVRDVYHFRKPLTCFQASRPRRSARPPIVRLPRDSCLSE